MDHIKLDGGADKLAPRGPLRDLSVANRPRDGSRTIASSTENLLHPVDSRHPGLYKRVGRGAFVQRVKKISQNTELLLRVAWEYYVNDLDQGEIARTYGMSRASVSRLLKTARSRDLLHISVNLGEGLCLETEARLRQVFPLAFVSIVPSSGTEDQVRQALGRVAAGYLTRHMDELRTVAVGWGRTISHIAQYVPANAGSADASGGEVVEMVGAFSSTTTQLDSLRLAANLAQRLRCSATVLSAPAVAPDPETCIALTNDEPIRRVLHRARQANLAIASLGTVDLESTLYKVGLVSEEDLEELRDQGAVGEILGRFLNQDGQPVPFRLDDRLIGLSLADLQRLPRVMVVAGGHAKHQAILAALRSRFVTHLVTDEDTALWILGAQDPGSESVSSP